MDNLSIVSTCEDSKYQSQLIHQRRARPVSNTQKRSTQSLKKTLRQQNKRGETKPKNEPKAEKITKNNAFKKINIRDQEVQTSFILKIDQGVQKQLYQGVYTVRPDDYTSYHSKIPQLMKKINEAQMLKQAFNRQIRIKRHYNYVVD